MIKSVILTLLLSVSMFLSGQSLYMTFTAAGAASKVDSVKATNLRTNEHVTLPGNDTLFLLFNTGITTLPGLNQQGIVFPNPCSGKTTLVTKIQKTQTVSVEVYNLIGQTVARVQAMVQTGYQAFSLSFSKVGIYMVNLSTDKGRATFKVICSESSEAGDRIRYEGTTQGFDLNPSLKETTIYTLGYKGGDIILYRCRGDIYTTIITDSPTASTKYAVEFALCRDPDGKNYAIVQIGTQTWMAENLAWLPGVSPVTNGSDSLKYYYVYDYNDSVVATAKNTQNYKQYGVLYNWPAAMNVQGKKTTLTGKGTTVCPEGWHLPLDDEWKILEKSLGMSQQEADTLYQRDSGDVGAKLKSSLTWFGDGNGSNFSGFTALPGGYRNTHDIFLNLDQYALFWSASQSDTLVWYRSLYFDNSGIYRFSTLKSHGFSVRCVKD